MSLMLAQISDGGRIVIPAEIRRQMNVKPGDQVVLSYYDGELHVTTRKHQLEQAQALVKAHVAGKSLSDELLVERKVAADGE